VERFPLWISGSVSLLQMVTIEDGGLVRLFPLERSQRVLNLVILRVLGPDIVVDASSFLYDILARGPV
jgi:hypothetical protein